MCARRRVCTSSARRCSLPSSCRRRGLHCSAYVATSISGRCCNSCRLVYDWTPATWSWLVGPSTARPRVPAEQLLGSSIGAISGHFAENRPLKLPLTSRRNCKPSPFGRDSASIRLYPELSLVSNAPFYANTTNYRVWGPIRPRQSACLLSALFHCTVCACHWVPAEQLRTLQYDPCLECLPDSCSLVCTTGHNRFQANSGTRHNCLLCKLERTCFNGYDPFT